MYQSWAESELCALSLPGWSVGVLRGGGGEWMLVVSKRPDGVEKPRDGDTWSRGMEAITDETQMRAHVRELVAELKSGR